MTEGEKKKSYTAKREEEVLSFWQKNNIFKKSLDKEAPKGEFVFYDGPPFATGLPHHGHFLGSVAKDLYGRYKTMRGYHVRRRWGWDCHGLPIENIAERELGLKSKKDIEEIGVEKFNETCRALVLRYADQWETYINRIGRWVEYTNSYKTMDATYMESVWWAIKRLHKKKLLYEGRKVLLYCPHCQTPLARAEIAMDNSYKDVTEEAVTVKLPVISPQKHNLPEKTYFLAWTTTPWTLPGNVALAVGEDIDYALVEHDGEHFIAARNLLPDLFEGEVSVKRTLTADELVGISYEPLYAIDAVEQTGKEAWYVTRADFVTTEEGTGIVHTAVIYGEEDYELGVREDLPMVPLLDEAGVFINKAPSLISGTYFKDAEEPIITDLEKRNLLFKKEAHTHSYPHCHRCETPLLYNAITSWFIDIQKKKKKLLRLNKKINWHPEHLKHGRFQNIVETAPDWTISRNRYWASPLPIWRCTECDDLDVIGSVEELRDKTATRGNTYFVMRHGGSQNTVDRIVSSDRRRKEHLTDEGQVDVRETAQALKKHKPDIIITSPYHRTKATAAIVAEELGIDPGTIIEEERLGEIDTGVYDGKAIHEYNAFFENVDDWFVAKPEKGESHLDVKRRMGEALYEIDEQYRDKTILIVTHGGPARMLFAAAHALNREQIERIPRRLLETAQMRELLFTPMPHNKDFELDLHRPYIDAIQTTCRCGGVRERIPEVVDGWVESGSMPFAEYHYPFENKREFKRRFPADFIAEYIAQTRTWFYYMHALGTLLFRNIAFKNVVTTGTILAEDGSKMSKSKKNYTDPLVNLDVYGADALRYYLMTSVAMQAEDLRFTDDELKEVHNRLVNILWNVVRFYRLYRPEDKDTASLPESDHVLDRWIIARLNELKEEMTEHLENYDTVRAGRPVRDFVTDLSTWYIRRSRDRFKGDDAQDKMRAQKTTRFVLHELSLLIAPFMPFMAESIYTEMGGGHKSVHLDSWPQKGHVETEILSSMAEVREIVSQALEARSTAGIKVRQPLASLVVRHPDSAIRENEELLSLIKEEVNVKEVRFEDSTGWEVELDTNITPKLKREGQARELIRHIQNMRKKEGLSPDDTIILSVTANEEGAKVLEEHKEDIMETTLTASVREDAQGGKEVDVDGAVFTISLEKKLG